MTKIGNILFYIFFFWFAHAQAAVTVQGLVDRNEMGMGDTLTVTVSVSSTESVSASEPRIPNLDGFELVNSWTSSSTSSKLMQGAGGMKFETVRRQDFNYMVTPQRVGNLSLPAFEVVVDGKTYYTKPIVIKVSAQGSGAAKIPAARGGGGGANNPLEEEMEDEEALFNQLLQRQGVGRGGSPGGTQAAPTLKNLPQNANEVLSVHVEVDKTDVYEGEQIVANWYIYTRGNLLSLDRVKFPDLKGFWKEIIEEVPALNFTQEVINGVPYRKALLASHALFPIKAGTAIIDEYKVKGSVQIPSSPYSSFGFGPTYSFNRSSERVKINVKPLPTEGKPKDFSGAVGQFDVRASIDGNQFPVNQPFSLKVRFEGTGNAKLIELPHLNLPDGVEIYDTKADSKYFKNGRSYKEFEVLIIPRQEGELKIPAMSFSMFDPQAKKYVTRNTEPIDIKIVPNPNGALTDSSRMKTDKASPATSSNKPALPDILVSWQSSSVAPLSKSLGWFVAFLGIFAALALKARNELGGGAQTRDLKAEMQKRMKRVYALADKSDWRGAGTEMTNVFYEVLGELSGQGGASLEINKLLDQSPPSLRRDFGKDFAKFIEIFQVMSFAPESVVGALKEKATMKKNIDEAQKLLSKAISKSETPTDAV